MLSLVSASNNALISPVNADATITILPDPTAGGIISILSDSRSVLIGEPSSKYNGQANINLGRTVGIFGEISVTWQIVPRDLNAFTLMQGSVKFNDRQEAATLVLQVLMGIIISMTERL